MSDALTLPALHASHAGIWLRNAQGEVRAISKGDAIVAAADTPHLLLNAPLIASRLGYPDLSGLDLLELFAFIYPARFLVPTPKGIASILGLEPPAHEADIPALLQQAATSLLHATADQNWPEREGAWTIAEALTRLRWSWAPIIASHLPRPEQAERWFFSALPEWEDSAGRPPPAQIVLNPDKVDQRLTELVGKQAEQRPGQQAYAREAAHLFAPRQEDGAPHMLLAQAGTGIGKTLGYLAPASLWTAQSGGTLWVSTFTKNLQRQLHQESSKAWPPLRPDGARSVVVRKGRENYLCLLNLEDALQGGFGGRSAILAYLVARWAAYSRDGDMVGGDLPGWLGTLFRSRAIRSLTDQRGECIYAGCPHYRRCFIERAQHDSQHADLVIANHALVMINASRAGGGAAFKPNHDKARIAQPSRIIFDEGHHVFAAADSTFSALLSGQEAIELRRWILGPERKGRGRRRGLAARLADIASYDEEGSIAIADALHAAEALPTDGWHQRLADGAPYGPIEELLGVVRSLTYARDERQNGPSAQEAGYGLETEAALLDGGFIEQAGLANDALIRLRQPLMQLAFRLEQILEDPPDWLDSQGRARVEGARHALGWRVELIAGWISLLERLGGPADPDFVDWLAVERYDGREYDIGIHRHWLDPMKPFARTVLASAHGVMLTSATLCDGNSGHADEATIWAPALARSGASHCDTHPRLSIAQSPFNYADCAEVLIVTDIRKGDIPALAGAYARLIEACGGGVLGLFTAIRRLRAVHGRIADRLARAGLPLYSQHVDPLDTGTLVDIFRDDPVSSLLGTDALRDGVDVPGESLRCVIMEQVPWPRPSILHRARRAAEGGTAYDDRLIRARLAQAFGRLIRSKDDRGHFVVLSAAFPSRLLSAFPPDVPITRLSLEEALHRVSRGTYERADKSADMATESAIGDSADKTDEKTVRKSGTGDSKGLPL